MKRKATLIILSLVCALFCVVGLTACNSGKSDPLSVTGKTFVFDRVEITVENEEMADYAAQIKAEAQEQMKGDYIIFGAEGICNAVSRGTIVIGTYAQNGNAVSITINRQTSVIYVTENSISITDNNNQGLSITVIYVKGTPQKPSNPEKPDVPDKPSETCAHDKHLYPVNDRKEATCTEQGYDLNVLICGSTIKDPSGYRDGICGTVLSGTEENYGKVLGRLDIYGDLEDLIKRGDLALLLENYRTMLPTIPHTPVTDPAVPATCSAKGLTEGSHCKDCNTVIKAQTETDFADHSYNDTIVYYAAARETDQVCPNCGKLENAGYTFKTQLNDDEQSYTLVKGDGWTELSFGSLRYNGKPVTVIGGIEFVKKGDYYARVGKGAFKNCTTLTYVNFSGVKVIGGDAFTGCTNLGSVIFGDELEVIASYAFQQCAFTSLSIPANVKTVGWAVFYGCSNLQSITLQFVGAGEYNDRYCTAYDYKSYFNYNFGEAGDVPATLKDVTIIGGSVDYFGRDYGCGNIESVTLGDGVTIIWLALNGCNNLKNITFGKNVTVINSSFNGCDSLTHIEFKGTLADWCAIQGLERLMKCGTSDRTLTIQNQPIEGKLVIPDGVKELPDFAFYNCGITDVTIPDDIKVNGGIGRNTFGGCSIETAKIPGSATEYVKNNALKTVEITSGYIDEYAFSGCSTLTSVTIGSGVTGIGIDAFYGCSGLTGIYTDDVANWCGISGLNYIMSDGRTLYIDGKELTGELVIPDGVTSIAVYAFRGCRGLTSVTIPNTVKSIGGFAFNDCSTLTSISYTGDVASWCGIFGLDYIMSDGRTLYIDGKELTGELVIPDSVTEIPGYAFRGCRGLTSVTIGSGVTGIGIDAFYGCSGLTTVTIPDSVTNVGSNTFSGCPIETATMPAKAISSIKNSALKTVVLTSGYIDKYAFRGCSTLTSVTIGSGVTGIGIDAFYGCSGLTGIYTDDVANWCGISGLNYIMSDGRTLYIDGKELTGELVIP
ncbi:MAG: leucine-rich repeat domain-containing protein, partial [Corallococcus sp.]|nr:leucine-rich repeat domain-containing protein [Corallococcus sp.]